MNHKASSQQIVVVLAAMFLLLAVVLVAVPRLTQVTGFSVGPRPAARVEAPAVEPFDYEQAADNLAARWIAIGKGYERLGLLTRDPFDYERAADIAAARWIAIGKGYERLGLLTRDPFDYEQAADNLAARWIAMGKGYERLGLLNQQHAAPSPPLPAAIVLGMAESLSAGDLDRLLTFWADDANFYIFGLPPNGSELVRGQEALRTEFAAEIENHQQLEVAIEKVRGNIITTREKTWHDFTRQISVAPLEAVGVYQIKDGKIANYAWTLTEESAIRLKAALAEVMPPESAPAATAVATPVSEIAVTFAAGTCSYDGPLALQAGTVQITMDVQDRDKDKYTLAFLTLDEGKDFMDLMASSSGLPPSWSTPLHILYANPGASGAGELAVTDGPVYIMCWAQPPDTPVGNIGPFEVISN